MIAGSCWLGMLLLLLLLPSDQSPSIASSMALNRLSTQISSSTIAPPLDLRLYRRRFAKKSSSNQFCSSSKDSNVELIDRSMLAQTLYGFLGMNQ